MKYFFAVHIYKIFWFFKKTKLADSSKFTQIHDFQENKCDQKSDFSEYIAFYIVQEWYDSLKDYEKKEVIFVLGVAKERVILLRPLRSFLLNKNMSSDKLKEINEFIVKTCSNKSRIICNSYNHKGVNLKLNSQFDRSLIYGLIFAEAMAENIEIDLLKKAGIKLRNFVLYSKIHINY